MQSRSYCLYRHENNTVREAYAMLAGNIYVSYEGKKIKSLVVTSTEPKVGKTSVATSLAITMATWGKKTVLIDADMRRVSNKKHLISDSVNGVYQYLQGVKSLQDVLYPTNVENLMYIPNGRVSGNPMGLLCSENLIKLLEDASKDYDYIVLDSPPLNSVSDAVVISSKVDATLLVARMGKSKIGSVKQAKEQLEKNNSSLLGVVINQVSKKDYKRYFGGYKYFYDKRMQVTNKKKINREIEAV